MVNGSDKYDRNCHFNIDHAYETMVDNGET